jgi:hypothetical protein
MTQIKDYHKRLQQARQKREQHAKQRRLQKAREHLQREQAWAQRHLQALEQTLEELGLPKTLVEEIEWKLQAQAKLLGKIFGLMFPTFFGCQTTFELTRVRLWDKNLGRKQQRYAKLHSFLEDAVVSSRYEILGSTTSAPNVQKREK